MNMLAPSKHILLIYKYTLIQARLSVTRHPGLDPGTSCMQQRWRFEGVFVWFPDQVRDDGLQEPHLKEDVFIDSLFIINSSFFIFHSHQFPSLKKSRASSSSSFVAVWLILMSPMSASRVKLIVPAVFFLSCFISSNRVG